MRSSYARNRESMMAPWSKKLHMEPQRVVPILIQQPAKIRVMGGVIDITYLGVRRITEVQIVVAIIGACKKREQVDSRWGRVDNKK
jgi:hypothetical protein